MGEPVGGPDGWLADTRASYDTVAADYAEFVRPALDRAPHLRAALTLFAELVGTAGSGPGVGDGRGNGPVADVGCGPGHVTAYLHRAGLDVFGIDLSPGMVAVARRDHPGLRFEQGTMTALDLPDAALGGLLAFWSLVHVPDAELPAVLAEFHRVLRPGAPLLLGFHAGDGSRLKTEGYGGHPMRVHVHRRPPERMAALLRAAALTVEAQTLLDPDTPTPGALLFARRL